MKSIRSFITDGPRRRSRTGQPTGFALVITLSLMVLLTLLAVGLLTLSSVSLRSSSQGEAMALARSNARLALILAIGELQKSLGPDRAVTASSDILAAAETSAKANLTGVWESWWDFNPNGGSLDYSGEKEKRFRRWLVSSADSTAVRSKNFPSSPWSGNTVELVGDASLGSNAPLAAKVRAGLVPVSRDGKPQGAFAWHVADESAKARVNLYRDPAQNTTLAQKRALLAGHRPDPSVMKSPANVLLNFLPKDDTTALFTEATASTGKIIDLPQVDLFKDAKGKILPFRNDVTPYSLGVLSDVRRGSLKQDLSSIFEMTTSGTATLPAEFRTSATVSKKIYQSTLGVTGDSDPYWSTLVGYYNSFRDIKDPETTPTLKLPATVASVLTNPTPQTYFPGPVIAKVDTIFSLVAHPMAEIGWWNNTPAPTNYDYFVSLLYTPVVTLHNPYNVSISFYKMSVKFVNVPVAFNFMFQAGGAGPFLSQSVTPGKFESINDMTNNPENRGEKTFLMTIADWSDTSPLTATSPISQPIVMKPGQTLICGPSMDSSASFSGGEAFDYELSRKLTESIKAKPQFTPGLGFEVDGVAISNLRETAAAAPGGSGPGWCSFLLLRDSGASPSVGKGTDKFYVEFQAQRPSWHTSNTTAATQDAAIPSFKVEAKLQSSDTGTLIDYAKLDFNYKNDTSLKSFFDNRVYRYPPTGSYSGKEISTRFQTPYASQFSDQHPFAIFSAYARTTNGGVYETNKRTKSPNQSPLLNLLRDGRIAGKPFLFHNPSRSNFTMDLAAEMPGTQAYELNLQPFLSKGDFQDSLEVDINRVPSLTGYKTSSGIKSGSYLEIPTGPLQTIADFRRSNALTSSYLPQFVQPVSNSQLHPLMSPGKVMETSSATPPTVLLDHSVLANHALYDRFYFSTFATRVTKPNEMKPDAVFEQFMNGTTPLASQAFQPYLPAGKSVADAKAELFSSGKPKEDAYKTATEYQMIRGPFNVNSTSVQAWKAVLAAMNKSEITTLWARTAGLEAKVSKNVPILAMSLLNGGANRTTTVDPSKIDNQRTNDWNGYHELTEPELDRLAVKIVDQVRARGPFLSMSEFVNRQVGSLSPLTLSGALEAAITESEINEEKGAVSPNTFLNQVPIELEDISAPTLYNYRTPTATIGNPAAGAPGWISQGDLLRILEPAATVRGDTFVIRVCGEAWDAKGKVTARAFAEAVVQRVPEYLDSVDRPSLNAVTDTTAATANRNFGRRINLVSFRWLSSNEI